MCSFQGRSEFFFVDNLALHLHFSRQWVLTDSKLRWSQRCNFHIYQSQSTCNHTTRWLTIHILRLRKRWVKLLTWFLMHGNRIANQLRLYTWLQFDSYRNSGIRAHQKVLQHPPGKALQMRRRMQFMSISISWIRSIYVLNLRWF